MATKKQAHKAREGDCISIWSRPDGQHEVIRIAREIRFGWWHLQAARFLVKESNRKGMIKAEQFACVSGAIVMSWCLLEALLHEFTHKHSRSSSSPLDDAHQQIIWTINREGLTAKNANSLEQFNMYLRIIDTAEIFPGSDLYQSANLVRELRNRLVHPVPESFVEFDKNAECVDEHKMIVKLRSRLHLAQGAVFPKDVMTPNTAKWALESVIRFLEEFERRSKVSFGLSLR